jgi:hypothetical protein
MNLDHLIWPTEGWGWMPPQDDVFAAFRHVKEHYDPKSIFEIGFCWGHSTTYQLEIMTDASIVTTGPIAENNMGKEKPDPDMRKKQIRKMHKVYGDRFKHVAGKNWETLYYFLDNYVNKFDYALIDGYHKEWAVEMDGTLCQDLNIPVVLVDNWDQSNVSQTIMKYTDYKPVHVFYYDQEWKGTNYHNSMGLCTL